MGIDARLQPQERSLLASRNESNDQDMFAWEGDGGLNVTLVPEWYFPDAAYLCFARGWSNWADSAVTEGEVEPPAAAQQQIEIYDRIQVTTNRDEQIALTNDLLDIAKENFWVMGTILTPPSYGIAKNSFRNVPQPIIDPAQLFYQIDACQSYIES